MTLKTIGIDVCMSLLMLCSNMEAYCQDTPETIHLFVALCDNDSQAIVPVPPQLGNGDDPSNNLYWGARYGVRTFFSKSDDWKLLSTMQKPGGAILERCVFKQREENVYIVADAYLETNIDIYSK